MLYLERFHFIIGHGILWPHLWYCSSIYCCCSNVSCSSISCSSSGSTDQCLAWRNHRVGQNRTVFGAMTTLRQLSVERRVICQKFRNFVPKNVRDLCFNILCIICVNLHHPRKLNSTVTHGLHSEITTIVSTHMEYCDQTSNARSSYCNQVGRHHHSHCCVAQWSSG